MKDIMLFINESKENTPEWWKVFAEKITDFAEFIRDVDSLILFDTEYEAGFEGKEYQEIYVKAPFDKNIEAINEFIYSIYGPKYLLEKLIPMLKKRKFNIKLNNNAIVGTYTGKEDSKQH